MKIELSKTDLSMLAVLLKRVGDEDVTKWFIEEKKVLDSICSNTSEGLRSQIELSYRQLEKKIEEASKLDIHE